MRVQKVLQILVGAGGATSVPCILFPKTLAFLRWGSQWRFREVRKSLEGTVSHSLFSRWVTNTSRENEKADFPAPMDPACGPMWPRGGGTLPCPGAWAQPPQPPPCSDPTLPDDDDCGKEPHSLHPCHSFLPHAQGTVGPHPTPPHPQPRSGQGVAPWHSEPMGCLIHIM